MQQGVPYESPDSLLSYPDRLEPYRLIIVEVMKRQGLCTTHVAREIGADRSHLGRIRRGVRPISGDVLNSLITYLSLDRHRLSLAVEVIGSAEIYFDPAFRNICLYVETVVGTLMTILKEPGVLDRTLVFASMSKPGCETLATTTVRHLDERFERLSQLAEQNASRDVI